MNDTYRTYGLPDALRRELARLPHEEAEAIARAWQAAGKAHVREHAPGRERVRSHVFAVIDEEQRQPRTDRAPAARPATIRRLFPVRAYAVAAALTVLVAVSFLFSPDVTRVIAPEGLTAGLQTELPDGSHITLAAGSRLFYTEGFGTEHRDVRLTGEAFFDVKRSEVPFQIRSFDAQTTVLGTRFNVDAWPTGIEARTTVAVRSGRVQVQAEKQQVILSPGQAVHTTRDAAPVRLDVTTADVDRVTSWTMGGFAFDNEPVGDAIAEIERRYDVEVDAPASIRLRRISYWKQSAAGPGEVLGDIAATIGVRYRATANGFDMYLDD